MKNKGFTLIELLVVIAIIGVLSSVLILVINPSDQINKAKAAKIAKDFKLIEKAFQLTAADDMENYVLYPVEPISGGAKISQMIDNSHLKYISRDISPGNIGVGYYVYDNDDNVYPYLNNCPGGSNGGGVNILIQDAANETSLVNQLDKMIDNSDGLGCGKLRTAYGHIIFNLDDNQ